MRNWKERGITLIALVVTIIVLLILAGVSVAMLTGENGIIGNAGISKTATELSNYKEELEQWKITKQMEDISFSEDTLSAGKNNLAYNGTKQDGNIKTIIPDLNDGYLDEIEVIKGELVLSTTDNTKIKSAKIANISANPYEIKNGELMSAGANLDLMSDDGTITIPENVTKIGEGAFSYVQGLKKIIIPGNVKEIGYQAFAFNSTLENVILEDGIETIGEGAFQDCTNLKNIEMPDSVTEIRDRAFYQCKSLEKIEIPKKIKSINSQVFQFNDLLQEVKFRGDEVNRLEVASFADCLNLPKITVTKNVNFIGDRAFAGCDNLEEINVDTENANYIYESGMLMQKDKSKIYFVSASYLNTITTFSIPEGVTEFNVGIANGKKITTLNIPSSLKSIGAVGLPNSIQNVNIDSSNQYLKTFENCIYTKDDESLVYCYSKDKDIVLKNKFKIVNTDAFSGASANVQSITFPESMTTIKTRAFVYCKLLKTLNIGKNANDISGSFRSNANFVMTLNIDSENPYYMVENNILYSKNKDKLVAVLYKIEGNFVVPNNVKIIGKQAFTDQVNMTNITINQGIEQLEDEIFASCSSLLNVEIPSTVTTIDKNCFSSCPSIAKIKINKKENSISGAPWGAIQGLKVIEWGEK